MAASAKRRKAAPEPDSVVQQGMQAIGAFVSRNPAAVGGSTAFLVALLYVSANAIWYQPHAHTGPLFATRSFDSFAGTRRAEPAEPQTTIRLIRPEDRPVPRHSDPVVKKVQRILYDLNFYAGTVDGIKGPNTRIAIETYQKKLGLPATGNVDADLLRALGADGPTGALKPTPRPERMAAAEPEPGVGQQLGDAELVAKIQSGLRAFGHDGILVDGVLGERTKAGIKEFQSLFGLPTTGEPDITVYAKMRKEKLAR